MDWALDQNDLFVKSWVQGCDPQETDTHWCVLKEGPPPFPPELSSQLGLGRCIVCWGSRPEGSGFSPGAPSRCCNCNNLSTKR